MTRSLLGRSPHRQPPQGAVLVVVLLVVAACSPAVVATSVPSGAAVAVGPASGAPSAGPAASPDASGQPAASAGGGQAGGGSSQALIAADLASGAIDLGTSLAYRAEALFWDPRLPAAYDGSGSAGEDLGLFEEIRAALPTLPAAERDALAGFLLRPTDPASPFSTPPPTSSLPVGGVRLAAYGPGRIAQADTAPTRCAAPRSWQHQDWSPDGSADTGVRVWACAPSAAVAAPDLQGVVDIVGRLWPRMAAPEPGGMGPPVPDTAAPDNDGNGKIDLYLLEPLAECRDRGTACEQIDGDAVAEAVSDPEACGGPSDSQCSAFMLIGRQRLDSPEAESDIAHELFHVLQMAHNADVAANWYSEASASWAEWEFAAKDGGASGAERAAAKAVGQRLFGYAQGAEHSLLQFTTSAHASEATSTQNQAWTWPLFQTTEQGPNAVFATWTALEGAEDLEAVDTAVSGELPFDTAFRDYAVRNAQPDAYVPGASTGLEASRWQTKPFLADFPTTAHHLTTPAVTIDVGKSSRSADVFPLAAQYEVFRITSPDVRQVTIDITGLKNAATADLDALLELNPPAGSVDDVWKWVQGDAGKLVLCRDNADQDAVLFELVLSNHDADRQGSDPDVSKALTGNYTLEAKDKCDVPDHFAASFHGHDSRGDTWIGSAIFDRMAIDDPSNECQPPDSGIVEYCYRFASGTGTWTWPGGKGPGACGPGSLDVTLDRAIGDDGVIMLDLKDADRPDHAGTYSGTLSAGNHVSANRCGVASTQVIAWISIGRGSLPTITPGYHLAGSVDSSGCGDEGCGSQSWAWDLVPRFDP